MGFIFREYRLEMVKEKGSIYDVENTISSPKDAYNVLTEVFGLANECEEVLCVLTMNAKNKVTGMFEVSRGTINSSMVHPREIFKRVLINNSYSFILAHNHPSGDPTPSSEDIKVTSRVSESGRLLGVELLDHIIIGDGIFKSLKESNLL